MSEQITVTVIATGGTFLTAVVALLLHSRNFSTLDRRIAAMEADNKEFFKWFGRLESDISRIKDHIGLKP